MAAKPNYAGYGTLPTTGNTVPTGSGAGTTTGNGAMPNYGTTPSTTPKPAASGGSSWGSTLSDPNLWASILGLTNSIVNRPKDGQFVQTPMPPEARALMAQFMDYATGEGKSPTRNLVSPMLMGMMQHTGLPQFQMTNLIEGAGIPKTANGQPWTYKSGGNPGAFDFNQFAGAFQDYLKGKAQGGNAGPRDLSNLKGPNGNPIGSKGRVMAGGKNKDMAGVDQGGWSSDYYRNGGGGMDPFAESNFWGNGGPRDEFGLEIENWRKTALENPDFSDAYGRYAQWMDKLPPEQRAAEEKRQAEIEAKIKAYGKAAVKGVLMDPMFYGSLLTGTTGIYALNKLKSLGIGVLKNEAGQYVLNKSNNNPVVKGLLMVLNNYGTVQQIAGAL